MPDLALFPYEATGPVSGKTAPRTTSTVAGHGRALPVDCSPLVVRFWHPQIKRESVSPKSKIVLFFFIFYHLLK